MAKTAPDIAAPVESGAEQAAAAPAAEQAAAAPAAPAAAAPAVADYLVISLLHHDGKAYYEGETVSLTEKQAKPLLGVAIEAMQARQAADSAGDPA